jgi:putative membrane protein
MIVVRVAICGLALLVVSLLVPGISIDWGEDPLRAVLILAALAVLFGVVRAILKPRNPLITMPAKILTLGLFPILMDAGLLLLVAGLVDAISDPLLVVGGFPPDLSILAIGTALVGGLIVTLVTTVMGFLVPSA